MNANRSLHGGEDIVFTSCPMPATRPRRTCSASDAQLLPAMTGYRRCADDPPASIGTAARYDAASPAGIPIEVYRNALGRVSVQLIHYDACRLSGNLRG